MSFLTLILPTVRISSKNIKKRYTTSAKVLCHIKRKSMESSPNFRAAIECLCIAALAAMYNTLKSSIANRFVLPCYCYIPNLFRMQLRILPQRQCATFAAPLPDNPPSPTEHSSRGTEINARKHSAGCNTGVGKTVNISRGKFCILTDCTKAMVVSSRDGWVNLVFPAP